MKKQPSEFESFDKVMDSLLSVPYTELQQKLEEEKQRKAERKRKRAPLSQKVAPNRKQAG